MRTTRSVRELTGWAVHAVDGDIGKVRELYFDDADWRVRYLVVDTGRWFPNRRVLLSPALVEDVAGEQRKIAIAMTREQVRHCPDIATDKPVALQRQARRKAEFNWTLVLAGEALASVPEALETPAFAPINRNGKPFDAHLRTTSVVIGLTLRADDGAAGRIADFIVDVDSWEIRYLVVELASGTRVVVPPRLVTAIRIEEKAVDTDLPRHTIAEGPSLDASTLPARLHEESVLRYYAQARDVASSV